MGLGLKVEVGVRAEAGTESGGLGVRLQNPPCPHRPPLGFGTLTDLRDEDMVIWTPPPSPSWGDYVIPFLFHSPSQRKLY